MLRVAPSMSKILSQLLQGFRNVVLSYQCLCKTPVGRPIPNVLFEKILASLDHLLVNLGVENCLQNSHFCKLCRARLCFCWPMTFPEHNILHVSNLRADIVVVLKSPNLNISASVNPWPRPIQVVLAIFQNLLTLSRLLQSRLIISGTLGSLQKARYVLTPLTKNANPETHAEAAGKT